MTEMTIEDQTDILHQCNDSYTLAMQVKNHLNTRQRGADVLGSDRRDIGNYCQHFALSETGTNAK